MSIGPDITEPATPTPPPGAPADGAAARRERQLDILSDLAEAGREIAMALKGRIVDTAAADPDPASAVEYADLARAFDRVSRATRMAIALSRRLEQDEPLGGLSARTQAREARDQQAGRVLRSVRRVAQARGHHSLVREAMERQARERLFDPDITGELLGRPIGALVAQICADLGLPVPWLALAEEAWAQAEITERPPGSPYAAWPDLPPDPPVLEGLEDPEDLDGDREGEGDWDDPGGSDP